MMRYILSVFFLFILLNVNAQCSYDESCVITPAFPNICPMQLPDATVGDFYSADLTFWMPLQFSAEGFDVNFDQLVITQISGVPLGLSTVLSNPSMVYYPSESEFGCANVSGTPLVAGDYVVTVSIVANVTVVGVGFEVPYPADFDLYLTVLPGSGGNTSFTYSPSMGCEDLDVTFEALITSEEYNVDYAWDFGNGQVSSEQYPVSQLYSAGNYSVDLTTTLTTTIYTLDNFNVNYTNVDCWGYDAEEACVDLFGAVQCWGDPEIIMKLYDANGNLVYQTDYISATTASWSNIGFVLNNPPYTVNIIDSEEWDELGGFQFSDNDELATFSLNLNNGDHTFNSSCSSGSYKVTSEVVVVQSIQDDEFITVFEEPTLSVVYDEVQDLVYVDYPNAISYQWFLDGEPIGGANSSVYNVLESGSYFIELTTENGCFGLSDVIDVVQCDEDFSPTLIVSDFTLVSLDTEYELEWFWNGLSTGFGPTIYANVDGYYWFVASDDYGCSFNSDTIFFQSPIVDDIDNDGIPNDIDDDVDGDGVVNSEDDDVDGDGIPNNVDNDIDGDGIINDEDDSSSGFLSIEELLPSLINIYPNPSGGVVNIDFLDNTSHSKTARFSVFDLKGGIVFDQYSNQQTNKLDLSFLAASRYVLKIDYNDSIIFKDIIIQ